MMHDKLAPVRAHFPVVLVTVNLELVQDRPRKSPEIRAAQRGLTAATRGWPRDLELMRTVTWVSVSMAPRAELAHFQAIICNGYTSLTKSNRSPTLIVEQGYVSARQCQ